MALSRVVFSSASVHWATPTKLFLALSDEFGGFTLDPCPLGGGTVDGLAISWRGARVFCNPPYGRGIGEWISKGREAELAVFLLPARTDTRWFHELVLPDAKEVRFLRGRLKFGDAKAPAPFPSMLAIFKRGR